jgi:hypothetical protein
MAVPTRGADGTRYHSQAEARRARDLRLLAAAGELAELIEQPRYELAPGFLYVADSVGTAHEVRLARRRGLAVVLVTPAGQRVLAADACLL